MLGPGRTVLLEGGWTVQPGERETLPGELSFPGGGNSFLWGKGADSFPGGGSFPFFPVNLIMMALFRVSFKRDYTVIMKFIKHLNTS